jgi:glycosyltransferase involved in cell wall biosynthesis
VVTPRVLHLGNILNNGYLNAKVLRQHGWPADAVGVDYWHVQGQPEWDEVEIVDPSLDHFNPDWTRVDLHGFQRPWWFHDPLLAQIPEAAEHLRRREPGNYHGMPPTGSAALPLVEPRWKRGLRRAAGLLGVGGAGRAAKQRARRAALTRADDVEWQALIDEFARHYPAWTKQLTAQDIADHSERALAHRPLLDLYALVQGSGLDPINVLIARPDLPFVCYEHGTMRDFPFEDSARGRLYALALKKAQHIIITNQDANLSAERLGLTRYSFIPHVVDEAIFRPTPSKRRAWLLQQYGCTSLVLGPARHHWKHAPPGMENSWFKRNDIAIRGLGRLFRQRPNLKTLVVFFEWGQEVALSKALIKECGFEHRVRWEPISSKPVMADLYNAADVVLDQFNDIGVFGTVVPESLACGRPVVLNFKREQHIWCYGEPPPCIDARTEEQVAAKVGELLEDDKMREQLGQQSLDWFQRHHSTDVVAKRHVAVYQAIAERLGWKWSL